LTKDRDNDEQSKRDNRELTKEERYRVEDVTYNKLQGKMVDAKAMAYPSEETVGCSNERQNGKHISTGNNSLAT
jgi:hypothetical protein